MPIISRIGGTSSNLNFHVAFYADSFPTAAAENTIGILTDASDVSQWVMQADAPAHSSGLVWIQLGTSSMTPFSISPKQTVMLYPIAAMRSTGSEWTALEAKCFQSSVWKNWTTVLYQYGNGTFSDNWSTSGTFGTVTENTSVGGFSLTQSASSASYIRGNIYHNTPVDVSSGSKLHAILKLSAVYGSSGAWFYTDSAILAPTSALTPILTDGAMQRITEANPSDWREVTVDISALSGKKYVGFYLSIGQNLSHTLSVQKIWID